MFSSSDKKFMKIALDQAKISLESGNYPVGAVLVIDGEIIDIGNNSNQTRNSWINHAEFQLLIRNADRLKSIKIDKTQSHKVELFSTLEPCIMCLGTAIMSRIDRIVFACPDPHGGATNINPKSIKEYYETNWPKIESRLCLSQSKQMLIRFMENQESDFWKDVLVKFREIE